MATPFKGLARFLSPQTPLAMTPAMRSQLVQQLLSQSQSSQGIVSPAGTANKALQGLMLRRAGIQEQKEAEQISNQQGNLASTLARGALDRPGEDPRMTDARARANKFPSSLKISASPTPRTFLCPTRSISVGSCLANKLLTCSPINA